MPSFAERFHRLFTAQQQSRSARTVVLYGWLVFVEGAFIVLFPHLFAAALHLLPLVEQAANDFPIFAWWKSL